MKLSRYVIGIFICSLLGGGILTGQVVTYPPSENISADNEYMMPSTQYAVEVIQNGQVTDCFTYMMNALQYTNRVQTTSFASFSFEGKVTVKVRKLVGTIDYAAVLPSSRKIEIRKYDTYVEFDLDRPGQFSVDFQPGVVVDHPLLIFADPPETTIPDRNDPDVTWFGPGVHDLGDNYEIKSNQTLYLEGGAYVKARFVADGAENVRILGRGILSGEDFPVRSTGFLVNLRNTNNLVIDGITIVHAPSHNIVTTGYNHLVRWVKIMGWWFSTDGINVGNNGLVEYCFTKVNDDAIRLYDDNSMARHCVIWQMENGSPFQIGWGGGDARNFYAKDIDIIRVESYYDNENEAVFCAIKGTGGVNARYLYEDIRVENCDWQIFRIVTMPNRWVQWDPESGSVADVIYRNITVYGKQKMRNIIKGHDEKHKVYDITFENLEMDAKLIRSPEEGNFFIDPRTTENVRFVVTREDQ